MLWEAEVLRVSGRRAAVTYKLILLLEDLAVQRELRGVHRIPSCLRARSTQRGREGATAGRRRGGADGGHGWRAGDADSGKSNLD